MALLGLGGACLANKGPASTGLHVQQPGGVVPPSTMQEFYDANPELPASDKDLVDLPLRRWAITLVKGSYNGLPTT